MGLPDLKLAIRRGSKTTLGSETTSDVESFNIPTQRRRKLKRSLTLPLANPVKIGSLKRSLQQTCDQSQSPLFQLLPVDIRLIVWEFVLSGHHIHIFQWRDRLGHQICSEAESGRQYSYHQMKPCLFRWPWNGNEHSRKIAAHLIRPSKLLPILYACRRTYSEAVDILYSQNVFHFSHPGYPIQGVPERILPHRWHSLRNVSLTWYFRSTTDNLQIPAVDGSWDRSCEILGSMANLKQLSVALITADAAINKTSIHELLGPMVGVRVAGPFYVYVSWDETETVQEVEQSFAEGRVPFVLRHLNQRDAHIHRDKILAIPTFRP